MIQPVAENRLPPALGPPSDWPDPDPEVQRLSCLLVHKIHQELEKCSGVMDFERYMELALYTPGLGYYSAGLSKFGAEGDFVTAPEISPFFSRCVARCCAPVLANLGDGSVLELGAGTGVMAADVLSELAQLDQLPARYLILETSAELRERQRITLAERVPDLIAKVDWIDHPPASDFQGVIVANEVLDALPVRRFRWENNLIWEMKVSWHDGRFNWQPCKLEKSRLYDAVEEILQQHHLESGYTSEININLEPWLATVTEPLKKGLVLFIDYGYSRAEYYHPQRTTGTLSCHYRHRVHDNPFILPGIQDITAHVDFSAVADAAHGLGLELSGFTNQAQFLFDAGLLEMFAANEPGLDAHYLGLANQIKTLTLPGEMGERFKCLALGRNMDDRLPGFRGHDFCHTL
jgi:SAM-dependent MidA family methyltransferase